MHICIYLKRNHMAETLKKGNIKIESIKMKIFICQTQLIRESREAQIFKFYYST